MPVDVEQLQVDLMSFSAHKIYGPKGSGVPCSCGAEAAGAVEQPDLTAAARKQGLRSGTLNVPGIVGLGHSRRHLAAKKSPPKARDNVDCVTLVRRTDQRQLTVSSLNGPALPCQSAVGREPELQFGWRRRRSIDDEHAGSGRVQRQCLYLGQPGAQPRAAGHGTGRGSRPKQPALRPGPL